MPEGLIIATGTSFNDFRHVGEALIDKSCAQQPKQLKLMNKLKSAF